MRKTRILLVGYGIIGRGVAKTLSEKRLYLKKKHGVDISINGICEINGCLLDEKGIDMKTALEKPINKLPGFSKTKTLDTIKDFPADIIVELTPGNIKNGEPGLSHIMAALSSGKSVATSNKAPFAVAYDKIMGEASKQNQKVRFEATVGGAIPIMNLMDFCLQANRVDSAYGILNGTTNYILSKMSEEGVALDSALKEAQSLGYAEPDPTYDIEGIDSAAKVVILANALLERKVSFKDVKVTGITEITSEAVELAKKHGYAIKLVGDIQQLEVSPRLIPESHPLNVSGSLNALMLNTDVARDITLVGRGAGARETSSSIVSDIVSIAKHER